MEPTTFFMYAAAFALVGFALGYLFGQRSVLKQRQNRQKEIFERAIARLDRAREKAFLGNI